MTGITREEIERLRRTWHKLDDDGSMGASYDQMAAMLNAYPRLLDTAERSLTEQSRIDEAVAKERERLIALVRQRRDLADRQHESVRALRNYSDAAYYASKVEALSGALADMTTPPR